MTCFLFDVKFWQMDHVFGKFASAIFLPNLLLRMRRNDHSCPSGINIVQNKGFLSVNSPELIVVGLVGLVGLEGK